MKRFGRRHGPWCAAVAMLAALDVYSQVAAAAEGYWPYTDIPVTSIAASTGVSLTPVWLDRVERATGFKEEERRALEHWLLDECSSGCLLRVEQGMEVESNAAYLESLREHLPAGDAMLAALLGGESPGARAEALAGRTRLGDPAFRRYLYSATDEEFERGRDPMLDAVRTAYPDIRARGREFDARTAALRAAEARLDAARYRVLGADLYPDTTGTFRLGFGVVTAHEHAPDELTMDAVPWYRLPGVVTAATLFEYSLHRDKPRVIPSRWEAARRVLDSDVALDFMTEVDGVAGNSGSVTLDANGDVVGVLFGGSGGVDAFRYVYEGKLSRRPDRSIHAATEGLLAALRSVYGSPQLVHELAGE